MHNQKKVVLSRSFTLIEALISLTLFAFITTAFMFWMRIGQKAGQTAESTFKKIQQIESTHILLKRLFENAQISKTGEFFFTVSDAQGPRLYFTTMNGVDPDPRFSNEVFVGIGLDHNKRLILTMWPSISNPTFDEIPPRTLVLSNQLDSYTWKFCLPNESDQAVGSKAMSSNMPRDAGTWVDLWPNDYKRMPLAVILNLNLQSDTNPYPLSFLLPACQQPIVVEK